MNELTQLYWNAANPSGYFKDSTDIVSACCSFRSPLYIFSDQQRSFTRISHDGYLTGQAIDQQSYPLLGILPAVYPEWLGGTDFQQVHGVRFSYVGGAMARGISSAKLVVALAQSGMLAFFGSAGLKPETVAGELEKIDCILSPQGLPYGANLIHSPNEPELEQAMIKLLLERQVHRVSASAFMALSKNIVWYTTKGLRRLSNGSIARKNYVFAKISHPNVAKHFMSPPPKELLAELTTEGKVTQEEAELAQELPVASDITVEADSGGHTDNRPAMALFSNIQFLRETISQRYNYREKIRLGLAGGLGNPTSIAAAYSMGADYVLVGSVHQATLESGLSQTGKQMLAEASVDDMMMAPSADMFEMGVKVQILKKGTMMGLRGNQLYQLYQSYKKIEDIPQDTLKQLEQQVFRQAITAVWEKTAEYFANTQPSELERAHNSPKHKMALIFRWYLGNSSRWALEGRQDRVLDYQIWCGPAIGAFNAWTKNSFLEHPENRSVQQIALNLLEGAATITRAQQLRTLGIAVPDEAFNYRPKLLKI